MFDIFTKYYKNPPTRTFPIKQYSRMDYVKRMVGSELERIKEYYSNRERGVLNNHLLVRLISLCTTDIELNDVLYRTMVKSDYLYNIKQLDIVSNINNGNYHENLFYNNNETSVLYVVENDIDWFSNREWLKLPSIRCVYHPLTDLDYYPLFRTKNLKDPSLFVFEIDIVLMMMQYKYWANERIKNDGSINPSRFIAMRVLPNMMDSMLNLSIFNRFLKLSKGITPTKFSFDQPFHVMDFTNDIDRVLNEVISDTMGEGIFVEQLLTTIPSITEGNMERVLRLHKYYYTRQSEWVLWISRIHYIRVLLEYMDKKGELKNKDELYYLPAKIRQLENRSTTVRLPRYFLDDLNNDIYVIKEILGKR